MLGASALPNGSISPGASEKRKKIRTIECWEHQRCQKKKIIGQRISRCVCAFCFFVFLFLFICLYSGSVSAGALYYFFRCTQRQYNGVKYGSVCPGASVFVCMRKFCPWQEEEEEEEEEEEGGGRREEGAEGDRCI